MAAVLSATGTWTPVSFTTDARSPAISDLNLETLKTTIGVVYPELDQFINLLADGLDITHWQAEQLLRILLTAKMQTWTPDVGSRAYPS